LVTPGAKNHLHRLNQADVWTEAGLARISALSIKLSMAISVALIAFNLPSDLPLLGQYTNNQRRARQSNLASCEEKKTKSVQFSLINVF
jgi:hypothetical protein